VLGSHQPKDAEADRVEKRSLTERFGGSLEIDGEAHWAFPDRTRLEGVRARELLEVTRNQRVAQRLSSLIS